MSFTGASGLPRPVRAAEAAVYSLGGAPPELAPGDYVVHVHHGIGRYLGIKGMTVDGQPGTTWRWRTPARTGSTFRWTR